MLIRCVRRDASPTSRPDVVGDGDQSVIGPVLPRDAALRPATSPAGRKHAAVPILLGGVKYAGLLPPQRLRSRRGAKAQVRHQQPRVECRPPVMCGWLRWPTTTTTTTTTQIKAKPSGCWYPKRRSCCLLCLYIVTRSLCLSSLTAAARAPSRCRCRIGGLRTGERGRR